MNKQFVQTGEELSRDQPCPHCDGSLAKFVEPDSMGTGEELRCLMCARTYRDSGATDSYQAAPSRRSPASPKIILTRPVATYLGDLLNFAGAASGTAFRLEKSSAGAQVKISEKQSGDVAIPAKGRPLLILSRAAARELHGSTIGIDTSTGQKQITVEPPRSEGLQKRSA